MTLLRKIINRSSQTINNHLIKNRRFSISNPPLSSPSSSSATCKPITDTFSPSTSPTFSDPHFSTPRFVSFLKFAAFGTITGAFATAGYATFAYTADEVDEKTKAFRSSISGPTFDDPFGVHTIPQLVYSAVMAVPSKAVDLYLDLRRVTEERIQEFAEPNFEKLLPDMPQQHDQERVFTIVLDLSETLIVNEWKRETGWKTFKRPGLDAFLEHLSQFYEIVVYTDKLLDDQIQQKLQEKGVHHILQRVATKYQDGKHFRDLSKLNRDPKRVLYVSGHALESCLQPENCVPIKPWKKEVDDTVLIDLLPFLEYVGLNRPADIRLVLASYQGTDIPSEFIKRSRAFLRQQERRQKTFPWSRN